MLFTLSFNTGLPEEICYNDVSIKWIYLIAKLTELNALTGRVCLNIELVCNVVDKLTEVIRDVSDQHFVKLVTFVRQTRESFSDVSLSSLNKE